MVVVTDGQSDVQQQNTVPEANNARAQGIEVYAVGIGPAANTAEISGIASSPTASHVVYVQTVAGVDSGLTQLLSNLCLTGQQP
jgi:collagen type VI alpha